MKCTNHPDREADGMCAYCGKPYCKDCLVEVKGRMYCKNDLGNVLDEAKQQASASTAIPTINITNSNESTNTNTNTNTHKHFCNVRNNHQYVSKYIIAKPSCNLSKNRSCD